MGGILSTRERLANFGKELGTRKKKSDGEEAPPAVESGTMVEDAGTQSVALPQPPPTPLGEVLELPLDVIVDSPYQPRKRPLNRRDVEELMASISANGQTSPIIAAPAVESGKYFVHSGHRRCAALRYLGARTVKAIVRPDLDERAARKLAVADNLGRDDLTAYEQALALKEFCDAFGVQAEEAAQELGLKRRTAFRLKTILSASDELLAILQEHAVSARAGELLVQMEARLPRKAQVLGKRFAAGGISLKGLEDELRRASAAPRQPTVAHNDVEVKLGDRMARLVVRVDYASLEDNEAKVARIKQAIGEFLGRIGVSRVDAIQAAQAEVAR